MGSSGSDSIMDAAIGLSLVESTPFDQARGRTIDAYAGSDANDKNVRVEEKRLVLE